MHLNIEGIAAFLQHSFIMQSIHKILQDRYRMTMKQMTQSKLLFWMLYPIRDTLAMMRIQTPYAWFFAPGI